MALNLNRLGFLLLTLGLSAGFIVSSAFARGKTFTGTVGDALCGVQHSMPVSTVECIRQCLVKGANYSLIVGDQVYVLETSDNAVLRTLEEQAGARVRVTGIEKGKTIVVSSVKVAR